MIKVSRSTKEKKTDKKYSAKLSNEDLEKVLDEMDEEIANPNIKYLSHEELFEELRRGLNE